MNRAGLRTLSFRSATHGRAKRAMLERAAVLPELSDLQVRSDSDLTVALIDSWAAVVDVLCFYQERILSEAFLRTCLERESLVHLAALVGYEVRPGLAASTFLAFTCEAGAGMRPDAPVIVDVGTKVQSLPGPGETPQTFETIDVLDGRANWSLMRPHLFERQHVGAGATSIVVNGIATRVRPGDCLVLVIDDVPSAKLATQIRPDTVAQTTTIDLIDADRRRLPERAARGTVQPAPAPDPVPMRDVHALAHLSGTDVHTIARQFATAAPVAKENVKVYALRARASLFGANAPDWRTMPKVLREAYGDDSDVAAGDWPFSYPRSTGAAALYLDAIHPLVLPKSWIVLTWPEAEPLCVALTAVDEAAVSGFALSAKVTRLHFDPGLGTKSVPVSMADVRSATVYMQSEELELAESIPEADADAIIAGNEIELDGFYPDLDLDRVVYVGGETETGERAHETATIETASLVAGGRTLVRLRAPLRARYRKSKTTLNANVAAATHGESISEVLGSGDASIAFQRFPLRQGPLTFLPDEAGRGDRPQLTVWVSDAVWRYVASFARCGPHDHVYTVGFDAGGNAYVEFGDGIAGSRVRTGSENVRATYRRGIGLAGALASGKLTMLLRQPLGVRAVTNPLPTTGAAEPESTENVRRNLGSAATILHRLVSLSDYEVFANAYAGVGKALAEWFVIGGRRTIVVTIAPSDAASAHDTLLPSLEMRLREQGDRYVPLIAVWYRRASFRFSPKIKVDPGYREALVIKDVRRTLLEAFGFERRALAEDATVSQVLGVLHGVQGVIAATVENLHRSAESASADVTGFGLRPYSRRTAAGHRLFANRARIDEDAGLLGAELLTIDPASLGAIGLWS